MYTCPICQAEMPYEIKRHIKNCEALEMGLLADQLTPTVEELPRGFDYPQWPKG